MTEQVKPMVDMVHELVDTRTEAIRVVRSILRLYGGQLLYLPRSLRESKHVQRLLAAISDEIGDGLAEKVLIRLMKVFGGSQLYLPLEHVAFRDEIADEIFHRYDGSGDRLSELCIEFAISFTQVYRLFHHGKQRRQTKQTELDFDLEKE